MATKQPHTPLPVKFGLKISSIVEGISGFDVTIVDAMNQRLGSGCSDDLDDAIIETLMSMGYSFNQAFDMVPHIKANHV